ncbi:Uncharacterised protein [BD1-7 clade bacterium]|uniref:Uncharacterized protein n=1 Tax=BD1-7 clade bacterium TaxID=2029982 RepID=A0A5S9Q6W5_9GAMM|nr:Uncharacterised protein [BD1-7 clade bacterium]CAA0113017.1 Uncharacterised protein [BD1-7 clade bacterium]
MNIFLVFLQKIRIGMLMLQLQNGFTRSESAGGQLNCRPINKVIVLVFSVTAR